MEDNVVSRIDRITAERDKLAVFKAYVHKRLDDAGVTVDPESAHKAEGCRIGGRLDELIGERDKLRNREAGSLAEIAHLRAVDVAAHAEAVRLIEEKDKLRAALIEANRVLGVYSLGGDLLSDDKARVASQINAALTGL